jgi:hypothetical protein
MRAETTSTHTTPSKAARPSAAATPLALGRAPTSCARTEGAAATGAPSTHIALPPDMPDTTAKAPADTTLFNARGNRLGHDQCHHEQCTLALWSRDKASECYAALIGVPWCDDFGE